MGLTKSTDQITVVGVTTEHARITPLVRYDGNGRYRIGLSLAQLYVTADEWHALNTAVETAIAEGGE